MKFKVTYTGGTTEEVETVEAETVEQFANIKFGISLEAIAEQGTTIEIVQETPEPVSLTAEELAAAEEAAKAEAEKLAAEKAAAEAQK